MALWFCLFYCVSIHSLGDASCWSACLYYLIYCPRGVLTKVRECYYQKRTSKLGTLETPNVGARESEGKWGRKLHYDHGYGKPKWQANDSRLAAQFDEFSKRMRRSLRAFEDDACIQTFFFLTKKHRRFVIFEPAREDKAFEQLYTMLVVYWLISLGRRNAKNIVTFKNCFAGSKNINLVHRKVAISSLIFKDFFFHLVNQMKDRTMDLC